MTVADGVKDPMGMTADQADTLACCIISSWVFISVGIWAPTIAAIIAKTGEDRLRC